MESWLSVVGYEGRYEVSDQGRVRQIRYAGKKGPKPKDGILAPGRAPNGYLRVVLCVGKQRQNASVHRLVLEAFDGPFLEGEQGNHRNGDKSDNRLLNLERVSQRENALHAFRIGLNRSVPGYRWGWGHPKLTADQVLEIRASSDSIKRLAERYGVRSASIWKILKRKTWKHI